MNNSPTIMNNNQYKICYRNIPIYSNKCQVCQKHLIFFSYGFVHINPTDIEEGLKKKRNGKRVFSNFFFCK